MFGGIEREGWDVVWVRSVTDKASSGMGVETEHEEKCQMMGVPENLKTLLTDCMMCCGVH